MVLIAERTELTSTTPLPPRREEAGRRAQIIECLEGHYEAQEVPFGVVYRWCPECVIVECGCGKRLILSSLMVSCGGCGAEHAAVVRGELGGTGRQEDEALRPWRYAGNRKGAGLPY